MNPVRKRDTSSFFYNGLLAMETPAPTQTVAHPHLKKLLAEVTSTTAAVQQLRTQHSDVQLAWKPDPGTWNILECLQHLNTVDGLYFPKIEEVLQHAVRGYGSVAFKPSFFGRTFIRYVSPESTRKVKTLRLFEPPAALTDTAVVAQFIDHQSTFVRLLQEADGVDLNRNKFSSPATRLIRFSVGEGLTMLCAHQRRHLQ